MPFWRNYYHIVWATKNREPFITPTIEPRLFAYIVRKSAELGAYVYAIDGWTEHTHAVAAIPPHVAVSHWVKTIKGASSHDLNQQGLPSHFAWQRGYGVLTLGQR
ncbi:MAG: IS200/IS605 family transposase [Caldilineales bacterium]|nr:IS200/IS605 family transposase [Caldilineales bacterium]